MDQRRKEALTALTAEQLATRTATEEMRERAHAEGRRMVEAAQAEAARIVADAQAAAARLRGQRQRIVEQLAASRADMDALLAVLAPLPEEQPSSDAVTPPAGTRAVPSPTPRAATAPTAGTRHPRQAPHAGGSSPGRAGAV
jgi:hypothetical protein